MQRLIPKHKSVFNRKILNLSSIEIISRVKRILQLEFTGEGQESCTDRPHN